MSTDNMKSLLQIFESVEHGTKQQLNESTDTKKTVDMTDKKCTSCKKGTYQETSQHDDMDGVLHCTNCNKSVKRHQPATTKKNISEGIMDVVKQTFNDCVVGYPQGTSEGQFIQGWARAIRAETGRKISLEKLTKLYHDYTERSEEIMKSHGTMDEDSYKDTSGTLKDRIVGEVLNFYTTHGRIPKVSEYSRAVRSKLNSLDFDERSKLHRQANVKALKLAGKQGYFSKLGLDEGVDDNDEGWPHSKPAEPSAEIIASNALDAAIRFIQDKVGNKSGDVAAHFFYSEEGETILAILKNYVEQEMTMSDEELNEITGDDKFDTMMGKITKGARYKGAAADQRADAAFGGMMNNVTKNAADVAKPSADSKFEQIYSAVERVLSAAYVHSEIDSDIMDALEKLKITPTEKLIQRLIEEFMKRESSVQRFYPDDEFYEGEQGVSEGLGKSIKRAAQGWGSPQDNPADIVKRNKGYDIDTAKKVRAGIDGASEHSPQGLQKRVLDRKLKVAKENFGGGMRDRPGSDTKSFDLAECKAFLEKRILKGCKS